MWFLILLAFIITIGILGALSLMGKSKIGGEDELKASDFEILEVKDKDY